MSELTNEQKMALLNLLNDIPHAEEEGVVESEPEVVVKPKVVKPKVVKRVKKKVKKVEKKLLELRPQEEADEDEMSQEDFVELLIQFDRDKADAAKYKKASDNGRLAVLEVMGDNEQFKTDEVLCSIAKIKSESIDTSVVFETLEDEELQELFDLGLIKIAKGDFERWVKGKGYPTAGFLTKGTPNKRVTVKRS